MFGERMESTHVAIAVVLLSLALMAAAFLAQ
jgi:hypothetical protein